MSIIAPWDKNIVLQQKDYTCRGKIFDARTGLERHFMTSVYTLAMIIVRAHIDYNHYIWST